MINTRHTTQRELKAIKQAIKLYSKKAGPSLFKKKGWTINKQGTYKKVFIKDNIVIKIGPKNQLAAEEMRWRKTKPNNKKYLARVFGRIDNMLIQRKVNVCKRSWKCNPAGLIAKKLKLQDWGHNHGHKKDGTPTFFDCVITKDMKLDIEELDADEVEYYYE